MTQARVAAALGAVLAGVVLSTAQAATASRSSAFEYDLATGLLTKEIIEPDNTQLRLETTYTYDAYGNKTAATVSSPATGSAAIAARTGSTTYDGRGQFPVSSTNALNQALEPSADLAVKEGRSSMRITSRESFTLCRTSDG